MILSPDRRDHLKKQLTYQVFSLHISTVFHCRLTSLTFLLPASGLYAPRPWKKNILKLLGFREVASFLSLSKVKLNSFNVL